MERSTKRKALGISVIAATVLLAVQPLANAYDLNTISSVPISVHGFATATGGWNDSNQNYMSVDGDQAPIKNHFGMGNSLAGIQIGAQLSQKLSFTTQIVGAYNQKFNAQATWAFVKYDLNPNVSFTAGRFRQPMYLYSDTYQVGSTYPWVNPPVEVYSMIPWYNLNGAMVTLSHPFDGEWTAASKSYYGMAKSKVNFPLGISNLTAKNVIGEQLSVTNNILTLQASYMHADYSIGTIPQLIPYGPDNDTVPTTPASFLGLGGKLDYKHFLVISEVGERKVGGQAGKQMPAYLGGYTTFGYQYHKWLPSITFAALKTTNKDKVLDPPGFKTNPMITSQNSITAGLKYSINDNMDVKGSVERVYTHGGYGMFDGFRDGNGGNFNTSAAPVGKPVNIYQVSYDLTF
jgi:hypothetical protein